jgi:hypothetical protein
MFGGLLGAGVLGNLNDARGIAGWRLLFTVERVITIGIALCSTRVYSPHSIIYSANINSTILPNFPANSEWLSGEERSFAQCNGASLTTQITANPLAFSAASP